MQSLKKREVLSVGGLPPALSHYADAVRFGDLLFISGMVALDSNGGIVGKGDVVVQAHHVFRSMQRILESVNASFDDVLKVTVFLVDVDDRAAINPVRQHYFGAALPASTLIGVKALALPDLLVEVEAVVGLGS